MIKTILSNLLVIVVLLGMLLVATLYTDPLKKAAFDILKIKSDKVLGVKVIGNTIDPAKKQQEVTQTLKDVADQQVAFAKELVLNVKVGDIVNTIQQSKKIVHDIGIAGVFVQKQIAIIQDKLPHNSIKK